MTGYTRQSSAQILTGEVVRAAPLNAEFNQVQSAFNSSTGHTHSGATGEGPVIDRIGDTDQYNLVFVNDSLNEIEFFTEVSSSPAKQVSISDGVIKPAVTNDLDLGSASNKFKDIYIDGTSYLDSVDINGGTLDNVSIGATTPGTGSFTSLVATTSDINGGTLDNVSIGATTPGTGSFTSLVATTSDINGGTLDNVSIGATTPGTGSFTTLNTSGNVGIGTSNPLVALDVNGSVDLSATTTEARWLQIGNGRTGNGYAYVDLIGDATYTDYGARFIRKNGGPNADTVITHRGTGALTLLTEDAAPIAFRTDNAEVMRVDPAGNVGIGTTSPSTSLHILDSTGGGILLEDEGIFSNSPNLTIIGKMDGSNVSQSFSGKIRLARNQTNAATNSNINLGSVLFGGNHTNSTLSNILYAASISGISEGAFNSSSDMPTGLAFYTGSTGQDGDTPNVNSGDERMRIDSSGNVGIGTTSPSDKLTVDGNIRLPASGTETRRIDIGIGRTGNGFAHLDLIGDATYTDYGARFIRNNDGPNAATAIRHRGTGAFNLVAVDAAPIAFGTDNTERMRIDSSGNVGIGVSNPADELDVSGNMRLRGTSTEDRRIEIGLGRTGNGSSFIDLIGDTTYNNYGARFIRNNSGPNAETDIKHRGTGAFNLVAEDTAPVTFKTSNSERMRIDSAGHVLIGTTSSATDLAYQRKLKISGAGPALILEETDASQMYTIGALGGSLIIRDATNLAARMTINSSGNVGIGTGTASPSERLEVAGKIKTTSGGVEFPDGTTQTTAAAPPGTVGSAVDGTATVPAFSFTSDNNTGLFRDGSGTVKVTSDGTEELTLLRASQAQAEAGTDNSVMMTPLRTAQAIQELSPNNAIPLSFVGFL